MLPLDLDKFGELCLETFKIWIEKYESQKMTPTVHKVLVHGSDIITNSILPVGVLSEEAAESRNKFYRNDRLFHARKTSRIDNMTDMFNRQLDTSDPFLSSIRITERIKRHNFKALPPEVQDLILIKCAENSDFEAKSESASNSELSAFMKELDNCDFEIEQ